MKCEFCDTSIKINWGNANQILCEYCASSDESQLSKDASNHSKENAFHVKTVVDAGDRYYEYIMGILIVILVGLFIAGLVGWF